MKPVTIKIGEVFMAASPL